MPCHVALSRVLRRLAKADGRVPELARLHNANDARLRALSASDAARRGEYDLLIGFLEGQAEKRPDKTQRRLFLVAVEYEFDDGAKTQGHGDALLVDAAFNMLVVECKLVRQGACCEQRRTSHVTAQAAKYAARAASWMDHLGRCDPALSSLLRFSVAPMILTDLVVPKFNSWVPI